jgi:hypothetical protein
MGIKMAQTTDKPPSDTAIESIKRLIALRQGKNLQTGKAAKAFLTWIADEEIDQDETPEEDISEAFEEDDDYRDYRWIDLLRTIADDENERRLGRFLVGRHGHKTRFAWHGGSSLDVACRVLGRLRSQSRSGPARAAAAITNPTSQRANTLKVGRIEVRLPRDVAPEEYGELIDWLMKLKG